MNSNYTLLLREYVESLYEHETLTTKERIEKARILIFDFEYPLFDPAYRKIFETNLIRYFYYREIGQETVGRWKFQLETWLLLNMPYFNKMFESELLVYDPLTNTKIDVTNATTRGKTSTTDGTSNSSSDGTLSEDNFDRQLESNNPDSRLQITSQDGEGVIEYASSIKENTDNTSKTSAGTSSDSSNVASSMDETEDYIQNRFGKIGNQSFSKMVLEYRSTLIRLELQVFDEMKDLFMVVY